MSVYLKRRKEPPRRVKVPLLHTVRPHYMYGTTVEEFEKEGKEEFANSIKEIEKSEESFQAMGVWRGTRIMEHNAGKCKRCKCADFQSLKFELMICAKCGHHVSSHVMNNTRIPRQTDPSFLADHHSGKSGLSDSSSVSGKFGGGRIKYLDGGLFDGEYRLFGGLVERHGIGVMKYPNGEIYCGGWKRDIRQGKKARLISPTGEVYFGTFRNGNIVGYGMGSRPILDGNFKYVGEWKDSVSKQPVSSLYTPTEHP